MPIKDHTAKGQGRKRTPISVKPETFPTAVATHDPASNAAPAPTVRGRQNERQAIHHAEQTMKRPTIKDLQKAPHQASVPRGGEPGERITNADRKMSSDGHGERFDDPVDHDRMHPRS